jgi:hypothetical protein
MTVLITPIELDFLWEAKHAGDLPYPLEIHSHGATMDDRARLRRQVHEGLRDRGMLDLTGRLEPRLDDWLGVLAMPRLSIDSVFLPDFDAQPVRALVAVNKGTAILATQDSGGLTIRQIEPNALISTVVDMLPPGTRGTELSISLPAEEFAAVGAGARVTAGGRASDVESRQALARLTGLRSIRGGQLAANSRSEVSGRRRSAVLAWFDNESGRYLGQAKVARDGREWTTVAPADAATLRKRISEMMADVTN